MGRPKIAVFIDYSLRTPSFNAAYLALKQYLFNDEGEELELEGEFELRNFWKDEAKKKEVEDFYLKTTPPENDLLNKDWKKFFFNDEHANKFIEDYSYNLFVDAEVPFKSDVEMLNIAQRHLFDVVLVDEYLSNRKKSNTFFYLSKIRIFPKSVLFLQEGDNIDESEYLGVWNPKKNLEQENGQGLGNFEMWLKDLEKHVRPDVV